MSRASISIFSNIAEGSLDELCAQLQAYNMVQTGMENTAEKSLALVTEVSKMLYVLEKRLKEKLMRFLPLLSVSEVLLSSKGRSPSSVKFSLLLSVCVPLSDQRERLPKRGTSVHLHTPKHKGESIYE